MEMRAITAEQAGLGVGVGEVDRPFPESLKPSISELADDLVSRMFGSCPPEMLALVQQTLLETARVELTSGQLGASSTTTAAKRTETIDRRGQAFERDRKG